MNEKRRKSLVKRIEEHPVVALIVLFGSIIGAVAALYPLALSLLCWLGINGTKCLIIEGEVVSPSYYFDGSENIEIVEMIKSLDGHRLEVALDIVAPAGPGKAYLFEACAFEDWVGKVGGSPEEIRIPIFIGQLDFNPLEALDVDQSIEQIRNTISCAHDFVHIDIDSDKVLYGASGGGTSIGATYRIRGEYLVNISSGVFSARRFYMIEFH